MCSRVLRTRLRATCLRTYDLENAKKPDWLFKQCAYHVHCSTITGYSRPIHFRIVINELWFDCKLTHPCVRGRKLIFELQNFASGSALAKGANVKLDLNRATRSLVIETTMLTLIRPVILPRVRSNAAGHKSSLENRAVAELCFTGLSA